MKIIEDATVNDLAKLNGSFDVTWTYVHPDDTKNESGIVMEISNEDASSKRYIKVGRKHK